MWQSPNFWYQSRSWQSIALYPVALIIRFFSWLRSLLTTAQQLPVPVICVGNIVSGGAGKTPTCIALGKILQTYKSAAFLSRGYGGAVILPTLVNNQSFTQVGDEPLILSTLLPTWVAKDRIKGAQAAIANGAQVLILDDGFQNPSLVKDLSFLVIDGHQGLGNGQVLPAGPLRETLSSSMQRGDAVILLNEDTNNIKQHLAQFDVPIFTGKFQADLSVIKRLSQQPIIAFAALGYPEKFFAMLRQYGLELQQTIPFADHYPYTIDDIARLKQQADGIKLVTTRKDMIKIPIQCRDDIEVIDIELIFDQPEEIYKFIREKII